MVLATFLFLSSLPLNPLHAYVNHLGVTANSQPGAGGRNVLMFGSNDALLNISGHLYDWSEWVVGFEDRDVTWPSHGIMLGSAGNTHRVFNILSWQGPTTEESSQFYGLRYVQSSHVFFGDITPGVHFRPRQPAVVGEHSHWNYPCGYN